MAYQFLVRASQTRKGPSAGRFLHRVLPFGLTVVVILSLWSLVAFVSQNTTLFPGLRRVFDTLWDLLVSGALVRHAAVSVYRILVAWVLAASVAIPLGVLMGRNLLLKRFLRPAVELFRPISPLAWIPLAVLWFGIGLAGKVFVIFIAAFFPILLNTITGMQRVNPILIKAARIFGCSPLVTTVKVCIPAALPTIATGLRISFGSAWMAIISAEMVASKSGLGYLIIDGMEVLRSDIVMSGMIVIGILGFLFDGLFRWVERNLTWTE